MFDRKQNDPLHTVFPNRAYLRPDVMRWEHVEKLRENEAQRNSLRLRSAWQRVREFASIFIGLTQLLHSKTSAPETK